MIPGLAVSVPMTPSTFFILVAEFGTIDIPLEKICTKYFGLGIEKAKREACLNRLPVPAYRASESQKAPWLINAKVLADHLDKVTAKAAEEWKKSQP